jgi:hypothetical protein
MRLRLRTPIRALAAAWLALALTPPLPAVAGQGVDDPAVVELFTSQGCASCPPADELLAELAKRADVVALSLHVDYWNYIGWTDPFAKKQFTERQQAYMRRMHGRFVYTPQIIVDGLWQTVGSRPEIVTEAIERARMRGKPVTPHMSWGPDGAKVIIPAGDPPGPATVWMAFYDDKHVTTVQHGENAGDTLANYNVVRELRRLATWNGKRMEIDLDPQAMGANRFDGCALLIQLGDTGPILGAVNVEIGPGGG